MPHKFVSWTVNYPGAIQIEAAQYGYSIKNNPKAWCLHTPEELADSTPSTPYYFHNTTRNSSTHYFVAWTGFVFQMVPENEGAYANARNTGTRFSWESAVNLNLQTLSVEIEGFAHNIAQTMPRGGPQWKALIQLLAHRCKALNIPAERTFGHFQVSSFRTDPGTLNIGWVITDINKLLAGEDEEDMPTMDELEKMVTRVVKRETDSKRGVYQFKDKDGKVWGHIFHLDTDRGVMVHDINPTAYLDTGSNWGEAKTLEEGNKDDDELLGLPVLFPKGIANLAKHVKKR